MFPYWEDGEIRNDSIDNVYVVCVQCSVDISRYHMYAIARVTALSLRQCTLQCPAARVKYINFEGRSKFDIMNTNPGLPPPTPLFMTRGVGLRGGIILSPGQWISGQGRSAPIFLPFFSRGASSCNNRPSYAYEMIYYYRVDWCRCTNYIFPVGVRHEDRHTAHNCLIKSSVYRAWHKWLVTQHIFNASL